MKNASPVKIIPGFILVTALLFMGCSNVFSPFSAQTGESGKGNVTVSFTDKPAGRTLLPSLLDFDLYEFAFIKGSYSKTFEAGKSPGGSFTFSVPQGEGYSLDVNAYKVVEGQRILAATGGSAAAFEVSSSVSVTIILTGNLSGNPGGTFSYNISYPGNAEILRMVLTKGSVEINLLEGAEETCSGMAHSVEVPSGWYGLEVDLVDLYGKVAFDDDIVRIYSDTPTFYGTVANPIVFGSVQFKDPPETPPPEDTGVRVYNWNGFLISDAGDFAAGNYIASDAVGTLYDSWKDGNGASWNDVLKLAPPEGGYKQGSMTLSHPIAEPGTYELSMDIWLNEGDTADIFWQNVPSWKQLNNAAAVGLEPGAWSRITGKFYDLAAPSEIALMANGYVPGQFLNNSSIFIKNLVVKKEGETPPPPGDDGVRVYNWNDFLISDVGDFCAGNYNASNAIGTLYDSWKDGNGASWNDVLKLEPPANGYPQSSMTLVRSITEPGTYELSMTVWLDEGNAAEIYWQNVPSWKELNNSSGAIELESGKWKKITGTFDDLAASSEIALMAKRYNPGHDLNDTTIYIKDLALKKAGETPPPPVDEGAHVDVWNGFIISGVGDFSAGNYSASNAVGTLYDSWKDGNGNSWNNILELAAPEGGYPGNTETLIHSITESGNYELSMDIWLNEGDTALVYWQNVPSWKELNNSGPIALQGGKWTTVSGTFYELSASSEIVLNVRAWSGTPLYLSATLYIKNLTLKKAGAPVVDNGKYIALTFDDAPYGESASPSGTAGCLDALMAFDAKATFFIKGDGVSDNKNLIMRMHNEGHEIGNHTFTHQSLYTHNALKNEMQQTDAVIGEALGIPGYKTAYFRHPFGELRLKEENGEVTNGAAVQLPAAELGMSVIHWDYESYDYNGISAQQISDNIVNGAGNNIVLCHAMNSVAEGLLTALNILKGQGYEFVTVTEFFARKGLTLKPGDIYSMGQIR